MSDEQQRAAELLSAANAQAEAPPRLHAQVRALRAEAAARRRRRFRLAGATSLAAAAAAVALLAVVVTDGADAPTIEQVAETRSVDAESPAPARTRALLAVSAPLDEHGALLVRDGLRLRASGDLVTWRRRGRTCVLSGDGVPTATLAKLAAWDGDGAVPS